jgi:lactoylglutathione lyase
VLCAKSPTRRSSKPTTATLIECFINMGVRFLSPLTSNVGLLMTGLQLNLIVLRVRDIREAALFYEALGIRFKSEKHGAGPEHFSGCIGSVLFELYPIGNGGITGTTRIGFSVPSITDAVDAISQAGGSVVSAPKESPWGLRAVVADPDGHRVELVENS